MKLSELMKDKTPNSGFSGFVTNDALVLAIDITEEQNAKVQDYEVLQMGFDGVDTSYNAETSEKIYIRQPKSTLKTNTQKTIKATGDRYIGDPVQDFCFDPKIKYGVGQEVIVKYVQFNVLTGKGESGKATIVVNSDGSGKAGESSTIDIDFMSVGEKPVPYEWSAAVV